jgi:hypothetical protein
MLSLSTATSTLSVGAHEPPLTNATVLSSDVNSVTINQLKTAEDMKPIKNSEVLVRSQIEALVKQQYSELNVSQVCRPDRL